MFSGTAGLSKMHVGRLQRQHGTLLGAVRSRIFALTSGPQLPIGNGVLEPLTGKLADTAVLSRRHRLRSMTLAMVSK
jgi:hypothetical protein